jgi:soluble lytic murein transglycosylase-like protein
MTACVLLACSGTDAERTRYLAATLEQRARHLASGERKEIARALIRAERRSGVDALLLFALAEEESRFKPRAKSRRGALGLVQVRPSTGRDVCRRHRIPWRGDASLFEPSLNLQIGATYLAELRDRFGSWDLALTAYHEGPTRARKVAARAREPSSRYAARVLRRFESLRQAARTESDQTR